MHPHLTEVFLLLDESRAALRAAVASVPAAARGQRPAPDRWSVTENLEHLALVEMRFTATVREAIDAARAAGLAAERDARLPLADAVRTRIGDRTDRREAPEGVVPSGRVDDSAAWAALEAARQAFCDTVIRADGLALGTVTADHRRWGPLTIYQWVEVLAGHEKRHAAQIAEITWTSGSSGPTARV